MRCPRCGTTVERGRTLCPSCKEPLGAAIALAAAQAASEARDEMAAQPRTLQLPALKLPLPSGPASELHGQPDEGDVTAKLDPNARHDVGDEPSVTLRLDAQGETATSTPTGEPSAKSTATASAQSTSAAATTDGPSAATADDGASESSAPSRPPERPLRPGDMLCDGRFLVLGAIGRHRLGAHYRVQDGRGAKCSAWVLRADDAALAESVALASAVLAQQHPACARTFALTADAGRLVAITEPIEGDHLGEHLARRGPAQERIPVRTALASIVPVAAAVAKAHASLVHGALDLDALYVTATGTLKLVGFGLGYALARGAVSSAPEAVRAGAEDDVRGVCRVLYALLAGQPFVPGGVAASHLRADLGPRLSSVLARGLSGAAMTAAELASTLAELLRVANERAAPAGPSEHDERWMIIKGQLDYGPYSIAQLRAEVTAGRLGPDSPVKNVATGARGPIKGFPALASVVATHAEKLAADAARAESDEKVRAARRYRHWRMLRTATAVLGVAGGVTWFLLDRMTNVPDATSAFSSQLSELPRFEERGSRRVSIPEPIAKPATADEGEEKRPKKRNGTSKGGPVAATAATAPSSPTAATSPSPPPAPEPEETGPLAPEVAPAPTELDLADSTDARGSAAREEARTAARRARATLSPCFARESSSPSFRGRWVVGFMVSSQGKAYGVRVDGAAHPPRLVTCIRSALARYSFPKFPGSDLEVEFPITISN